MSKDVKCKYCDRRFGSKSARNNHIEDKHGDEVFLTPTMKKKALTWTVGIVFMAVAVYGIISVGSNYEPSTGQPMTQGAVHWHADLKIFTCGEFRDLSNLGSGSTHVGTPVLHTHGDNKIHVEGQVDQPEDISLASYFDAINKEFSNNTILDKTNGDECPDGEPGEVKLFVNGERNYEYDNYVVQNGDSIKITFN